MGLKFGLLHLRNDKLKVFDYRLSRKISGPKGKQITGSCGKEFYNLYSSPNRTVTGMLILRGVS
jgi:hypothetical protein